MMKKHIIALCLSAACLFSGCAIDLGRDNKPQGEQKVIDLKNTVVFGDSYSTFAGYIPSGNAPYYPSYNVIEVEQTWWMQLMEKAGGNLLLNESYSGSTICNTGYNGVDCSQSTSFLYRYDKLKRGGFFEENEVNTVIVFGGINDSWAKSPFGK